MQAIRTDFQPMNRITTPLEGIPSYTSSGIIKAVMKSGEKVSVAQIDYQEFDEENEELVPVEDEEDFVEDFEVILDEE